MFLKSLAELFGTFSIVFIGFGSVVLTERFPSSLPTYTVPFAWGGIIAVMIYSMAHVSGAHFNPAVTAACVVAKRLPLGEAPYYWTSQIAGGLAAIILVEALKRA